MDKVQPKRSKQDIKKEAQRMYYRLRDFDFSHADALSLVINYLLTYYNLE